MKKIILLFLSIPILAYTQVPSYYNDVNLNLSGNDLYTALSNKVTTTHTTFLSYSPGVWNALKQTDLDPSNTSKVILIYGYNDTDGNSNTDRTRGVNENGGGSTDWNREHVYPKSLGSPNLGTSGPGADAHHLRPADVQRNSSRGNRKFADGSGNSGTTSQGHWYPGDEFKGDVARMMMYMYIRYGNRCLPIHVGVGASAASDSNMLQLFLEWNAEDPVSQLELQRNPILENIQGNRNPFIDNPAFATEIWGGPQAEDRFDNATGDTQAPTIPQNLVSANTTSVSTTLSWGASTDNVGVVGYDIYQNGTFLNTVSTTNYAVAGLVANTTYSFFVKAKDAAGNISGNSNVINITTQNTSSGGNATALFLSEYIEGSSNNKAIEIANFTGAIVDLSSYSIKRQTNGSGSWSSGLNLTGSVSNNDVFVIANSSASNTIKNQADMVSGASAMTFNGNDPVGLFKNDVLIDIIGTFGGGSSNFAKDVTLRRKSNVSSPSTTYQISEWNSFPQNTFDDLGSHTFEGTSTGSDTEAPTIPANVSSSSITTNSIGLLWAASSDNVGVAGYSIYQNGNLLTTTNTTNYTATGLTPETSYTYQMAAYDAAGNTSGLSNVITVTTQSTLVTYCSSKGNTVDYEYIDYVAVGGISNSTGANSGYGDFTAQVGNLTYGTNTITLSAGFASASYIEYWSVWVDYNKNGNFEASEKVVDTYSSSSDNLSYTFSVPASAISGTTRMRVSMKWNATSTPCETFSYGEVEDYTVNIAASRNQSSKTEDTLKQFLSAPSLKVYPNPATSYVMVHTSENKEVDYMLFNTFGTKVKSGKTIQHKIDIAGIASGLYLLKIYNHKGTPIANQQLVVE